VEGRVTSTDPISGYKQPRNLYVKDCAKGILKKTARSRLFSGTIRNSFTLKRVADTVARMAENFVKKFKNICTKDFNSEETTQNFELIDCTIYPLYIETKNSGI